VCQRRPDCQIRRRSVGWPVRVHGGDTDQATFDAIGPLVSLAVVDGAGHALPHEQPDLLRALVTHWLTYGDM